MNPVGVNFDFKDLADTVRDALLADPFFAAIPAFGGTLVVSLDSGDIETTIQQSLNKIGLNITVTFNEAVVLKPNRRGPYFDEMNLVLIITEKTTVNRAITTNNGNNPTAQAVASACCAVLHQLTTDGVNELFVITRVVRVLTPPAGMNVWNVFVRTQGGLDYQRPAIAPVVATPAGPGPVDVVLSCATPGAAIWYTLDNSYPSPRGPTSQLYIPSLPLVNDAGVPIPTDAGTLVELNGGVGLTQLAIPAGTTLRARAWLAGYTPANPAEIQVQY